jgi:UDP-MurNAc hydroxylase
VLIEYIANSCFIYTFSNGKTLISDPWIVSECNQTWYPFPAIPEEKQKKILSAKYDYLYISHLHEDHLHAPTLGHFNKEVRVLIAKMDTPHLKNKIIALGFKNITEVEEWKKTKIDRLEVAVFTDFNGSWVGDHDQELMYNLDTSLWVWDENGQSVFNATDNSILPADCKKMREMFGPPDVAILPYASASIYPAGMRYPREQKLREMERLNKRTLEIFYDNAVSFGARKNIPAGGEYVLGGKVASLTEYLCIPTPEEIVRSEFASKIPPEAVCKLYLGDVLDTTTWKVREDEQSPMRNYSHQDCVTYAESLKNKPCKFESFRFSDDVKIPWGKLLRKAYLNLFEAFRKRSIAKNHNIVISAYNGRSEIAVFFSLTDQKFEFYESLSQLTFPQEYTYWRLEQSFLLQIILGVYNWNAEESNGLLELERRPDIYDPTLHLMMTFFVL